MASHDYHFTTHWTVSAPVGLVADILEDPADLPRWWPDVYLEVSCLAPPGPDRTGGRWRLLTKGWLPYRLRWSFTVVESRSPYGFTLVAEGDFVGTGIWRLWENPARPVTHVEYDWTIRAEKPLLRDLSWLLKPVFAANHRWAMARGEESIRREAARRLAETAGAVAGDRYGVR
jgi:hypothetical protein